jgi:hypothetical protein
MSGNKEESMFTTIALSILAGVGVVAYRADHGKKTGLVMFILTITIISLLATAICHI